MKRLLYNQLKFFHKGIAFIENQGLFGYLYYGFIGYTYASIVANFAFDITNQQVTAGRICLFLLVTLIVFLFYAARLIYPCQHIYAEQLCVKCGKRQSN